MSRWVSPAVYWDLARPENNIFPRLPRSASSQVEGCCRLNFCTFLLLPCSMRSCSIFSMQQVKICIVSSLMCIVCASLSVSLYPFSTVRFAYLICRMHQAACRNSPTKGWCIYCGYGIIYLQHTIAAVSFVIDFSCALCSFSYYTRLESPSLSRSSITFSGSLELIRCRNGFAFLEKIKNPFITIN